MYNLTNIKKLTMKYYLINNRIMKATSEMPTRRIVQHKDYNQKFEDAKFESFYNKWKFDLVSCEISESELEKITWAVTEPLERIIDVTNIIEEIGCGCGCNESFIKFKQTSDNNGVITFKEKQVDGEIEAVYKLLNAFGQFCTLNGIKLTDSNKVGQAVIDFLKSDIYETFKNRK